MRLKVALVTLWEGNPTVAGCAEWRQLLTSRLGSKGGRGSWGSSKGILMT